jgi:hypothetical protein
MEKTYRTKNSFLLLESVIFITLLAFVIACAIYLNNWLYYFLAGIFIVIALLMAFFSSTFRNRITINAEGISGLVNRGRFALGWSNIKAATIEGQGSDRRLILGTQEGFMHIELAGFDESALWENIKAHLPSEAFAEDACKNLPAYKQWQAERKQFTDQFIDPVVVRYYRFEKILGWIAVVGGTVLTIYLYFRSIQEGALTVFFCFVVPGLILLLYGEGKIEADSNKIVRQTIIGKYAIQWDEIQEVLVDHKYEAMSLLGENKRLVMPGSAKWYGEDREKLYYLVQSKLELAGISVRRSGKPVFSLSKNTRVKS